MQMSSGQCTLNRPTQLLYPQEIHESEDNNSISNSNTGEKMAHDSPGDASESDSHSHTYKNHCLDAPQNKSPGSSNNQHPSSRTAMQAKDKILSQLLQDELMDY